MYDSTKTAEKIKEMAKLKKIAIKDLLSECQLSKNALSSMLSRGSWLQANNLAKIADRLGCSVDYLLGRTDVPEINKKESNVINITPKTEFTGELAAFGGDFVSSKKPTRPEIL